MRAKTFFAGIIPLVLLAAVLLSFGFWNPLASFREGTPPVEDLTFTRATLSHNPSRIALNITNAGPTEVTIAQVSVDDAFWKFRLTPDAPIGRLDRATVRVDYPWVDGEAHEIKLVSTNGVVFSHSIEVALESPKTDSRSVGTLALLGIYLAVVPVVIGLLWLPWVRRLPKRWVDFLLALTCGLLIFLAFEAIVEAFELASSAPGGLHPTALILVGVIGSIVLLELVSGFGRSRNAGELTPLFLATTIAIGIGLHNLGEGLAVGSALAVGEVGFSTFLIFGFVIHNTTEGLGIVAPLSKTKTNVLTLLGLGLLAGLPAAVGAIVGGTVFSPTAATFFFAVGAGAILQVVYQLAKIFRKAERPYVLWGTGVGVSLMWLTSLLVAA